MFKKELSEMAGLLSDEHLRERITPRFSDPYYLHLSDILLALKPYATGESLDILDYGAGISPYRSLFPNARYKRADFSITKDEKLDFVLDESLVIETNDKTFDRVISTQVLEHVESPEAYLGECLRVLRPGGGLILTTHGIFGDHPCPLDFHRWTADGLAALCQKTGFKVVLVQKLTTNARALFFLYDLYGRRTHRRALSFLSAIFAVQYRLFRRFRNRVNRWADDFFSDSRVVLNQADDKNDIYINIFVYAVRQDDKK